MDIGDISLYLGSLVSWNIQVGCIYNLLGGSMGTSSVLTMALTSSDPGSTAIMEARRLELG